MWRIACHGVELSRFASCRLLCPQAYFDFYDGADAAVQRRDFVRLRGWLGARDWARLAETVRKRLPQELPTAPQPAEAAPQRALPQPAVDRILRLSPDDADAVDIALDEMVFAAALSGDEMSVSTGQGGTLSCRPHGCAYAHVLDTLARAVFSAWQATSWPARAVFSAWQATSWPAPSSTPPAGIPGDHRGCSSGREAA